ncbi:hypothetical protein GLOIN_2v1552776 [Rhizophagus irregularis DAOM 181602=DAOM 197198]|uniref:Uncharacterized protein n=1 Tax=Rhizophagus irregularis (strain DAOM 181602 / DAOM 197198 / MUCL 43194) TaxID=747089 RepID=A0A2P4QGT3_RHIID|nr:hypothetical protein GLOIN_2v1552776 [Rhizophagus irregularis DAOM 181602=DAOM 197198]POG76828.1 hypothetical protein GLOIN_2v1552776 [Rhizophagus irregularis DAOM 181602=DAOM 197198]|eukprot:XP_025183694.1 hypothetical protein GLOIN_2v1552776 [Rhizophagus irregularis DAOM 181602=DAOM 197198]
MLCNNVYCVYNIYHYNKSNSNNCTKTGISILFNIIYGGNCTINLSTILRAF